MANAHAARLGWTETAQQVFYRDTLGLWQVYFEKPASDWARPGNYALFIHDRTAELVHVRAPGGTAGGTTSGATTGGGHRSGGALTAQGLWILLSFVLLRARRRGHTPN